MHFRTCVCCRQANTIIKKEGDYDPPSLDDEPPLSDFYRTKSVYYYDRITTIIIIRL
jgi:hypothetical protein